VPIGIFSRLLESAELCYASEYFPTSIVRCAIC
jgi:hypothetical protein